MYIFKLLCFLSKSPAAPIDASTPQPPVASACSSPGNFPFARGVFLLEEMVYHRHLISESKYLTLQSFSSLRRAAAEKPPLCYTHSPGFVFLHANPILYQ